MTDARHRVGCNRFGCRQDNNRASIMGGRANVVIITETAKG